MMKAFLVDDEIAIRENLRNSFPWETYGFQLVGEAPDGEMALPMIRDLNPDILLTDIRMPFMDGMALTSEVRRSMPWVHVIILSGYDDFAYAQQAMSFGVREYLLKPVTAQELGEALIRVRNRIEEEKRDRANMDSLRQRVASGNRFVKDKLLASLFNEENDQEEDDMLLRQMRGLGINLSAACYLVIDIAFDQEPDRRMACRDTLMTLAEASGGTVLVCGASKGARALILGDSEQDVEERAYSFAGIAIQLPDLAESKTLLLSIGDTVKSFYDIRSSMHTARHMRHVFAARGDWQHRIVDSGRGVDASPVDKARVYLNQHYKEPSLMLQDVARQVGLSQSHLSTVFAQETGSTFTQYLTALRIGKAKELLVTTQLRSSEIAFEVGYNDAHYFSYLFKKVTGMTPGEFRRAEKEASKKKKKKSTLIQ